MAGVSRPFFLIVIFSLGIMGEGFAESPLRVESFPAIVRQGDVCLVKAFAPSSPGSLEGEFRKERFSLVASGDGETYKGLLGMDLNIQPMAYEVKVYGSNGRKRSDAGGLTVKVDRSDFGIEKLSLPLISWGKMAEELAWSSTRPTMPTGFWPRRRRSRSRSSIS